MDGFVVSVRRVNFQKLYIQDLAPLFLFLLIIYYVGGPVLLIGGTE